VSEPDALGLARGPGGVDEARKISDVDRVDPRLVGVLVERLVAEGVDLTEGVHVVGGQVL